jgi:hypothetical protein
VKDTENMVEQRTADVRTVGWSLRQKEILGIVLDVIQSLRSRIARALLRGKFLSEFYPSYICSLSYPYPVPLVSRCILKQL